MVIKDITIESKTYKITSLIELSSEVRLASFVSALVFLCHSFYRSTSCSLIGRRANRAGLLI